MRVLHIGLSCTHGGAETFISALVAAQKKAGAEADVFFLLDMGAADQFAGLCTVMFAREHSLTEVLVRGNYDVLHLSNQATWARPAIQRSRYDGATVVTHHAWWYDYGPQLQADVIVAVSKAGAEAIASQFDSKVRVVYNGVDVDEFCPPNCDQSGGPIMAWVGRSADPYKDVGGLVAVATRPELRDFRIQVADGSPNGTECGPWLPATAQVHSRKPHAEMPSFYQSVASTGGFLLSTSRLEACPINILEAQACGCPVIAPAMGGTPELIEHQSSGFVYEWERGVEAILDGVNWLYSGAHYGAASRRATDLVREKFTLQGMCCAYTDIYEEAMRIHKHRLGRRVFQVALRCALPLVRPGGSLRGVLRRRSQ